MATIAELRVEADKRGVDLSGLRKKSEIEAALASTGDSDDSDTNESIEAPISFAERARRAGFGSGEVTRMVERGFDTDFNFETSNNPDIPRQARQADYATLERMVRGHSQLVPIEVPRMDNQPFDLPVDHGLSGPQLQKLLAAIQQASDDGQPFPSWEDFS